MCGHRDVIRHRCVGTTDRESTRIANVLVGGPQPMHNAVINQAIGMLAAQLHCDVVEAAVRLRAYSVAQDQPLDEIAHAIIQRRLP
ncbi:MAG: ANTAR domain-containing protein [Acidimicrobiia bacterium]